MAGENDDDKAISRSTAHLAIRAYDDAIAPIARKFGHIGQMLMSFVSIPLTYKLEQFKIERLERFLEDTIIGVPEERRQLPHPAIAKPIIDNALLLAEDDPLREMFKRLMQQAIDINNVDNAHPAFARIIADLAPDEAHVLFLISNGTIVNLNQRWVLKGFSGDIDKLIGHQIRPNPNVPVNYVHYERKNIPIDCLKFPNNASMYLEHIVHLGLVREEEYKDGARYFTLSGSRDVVIVDNLFRYTATDFGKRFMDACLPLEWK